MAPEFKKRGVKLAAVSCNDTKSHKAWIKDIIAYNDALSGDDIPYPIIADPNRELAVKLGMLDPEEKDAAGLPMTARAVFIIHKKKLKLSLLYPATTGRNFDEVLRVVDSLQITHGKSCATPANWTEGSDVFILPSVSDEQAKKTFGDFKSVELPSGKKYIRSTKL